MWPPVATSLLSILLTIDFFCAFLNLSEGTFVYDLLMIVSELLLGISSGDSRVFGLKLYSQTQLYLLLYLLLVWKRQW